MAYAGLKGSGLSVKIAGVEHVSDVHGMVTETTSNGDGEGHFWVEPADPFNVRSQWPEFREGATVDVTHTYDAVTTQLYKGFILSDPRTGDAGPRKVLNVECGGVMEAARWRGDAGFVYTDSDTDQWFENKKNPKWANIDISDALEIRIEKGTKVPPGKDRAVVVGYLVYEGAEYLYKGHSPAGPMNGVKRMTSNVTTKLEQNIRAGVYSTTKYKVSRNPDDYTTVKFFNTESERHLGNKQGGARQDYGPIGGADGAGYLIIAIWNNGTKTVEMEEDRYIRFDNPEVYTDTNERSVDWAMIGVANTIGMHTTTTNSAIGSVLQSLVARPPTDPISAMNTFVQQADCLVQWGWWGYYDGGSKIRFYARPLETNPVTIRALANCHTIDAEDPGVTWSVRQHPEDGSNWKGLRFQYGRLGRSDYPAGFPDAVFAPGSGANWGTGKPFLGAMARVLTVDFTSHNYTPQAAKKLAMRLWRDLGSAQSSGSCRLLESVPLVARRGAPSVFDPAPYIKGGDWVECAQSNCGPLLVTRSRIDYDTETVDFDLGLEEEALLEQLEAAGAIKRVKLAKWRRRGWRSKK